MYVRGLQMEWGVNRNPSCLPKPKYCPAPTEMSWSPMAGALEFRLCTDVGKEMDLLME